MYLLYRLGANLYVKTKRSLVIPQFHVHYVVIEAVGNGVGQAFGENALRVSFWMKRRFDVIRNVSSRSEVFAVAGQSGTVSGTCV